MDPEQVIVAGMTLAVLVLLGRVIVPIAQAYSRKLEGSALGAQSAEEFAELEARVRELEARESRVAELEERVDFAERLLARQRDGESLRLPGS